MRSISRFGLGFVLSAGLVACGEPRDADTALEPEMANSTSATLIECPSDQSYSASGLILPTGGSVSVRGHSVSLPLGAVISPTEVALAEPASQYMMIDLTAAGQEHFQFRAPLTVTISYARCTRSDIDKAPLTVWHVDPATGALLQNMGGTDDKTARTVTFQTDHFSGYAIAN